MAFIWIILRSSQSSHHFPILLSHNLRGCSHLPVIKLYRTQVLPACLCSKSILGLWSVSFCSEHKKRRILNCTELSLACHSFTLTSPQYCVHEIRYERLDGFSPLFVNSATLVPLNLRIILICCFANNPVQTLLQIKLFSLDSACWMSAFIHQLTGLFSNRMKSICVERTFSPL